ncbi:hypothetical protein OD808_21095 [Aeromonas veronii]|uniref:hypothetical protein n=1 Tax=Aeromonas veronii TaxID=654 RepID=UPI002245686D|nr:hypothetical protein [Aeromonas veronii]MCX0433375.1 hypothetical protein [Aeromonas veronii]
MNDNRCSHFSIEERNLEPGLMFCLRETIFSDSDKPRMPLCIKDINVYASLPEAERALAEAEKNAKAAGDIVLKRV